MNRGMSIATGEYIGILEPDDFADSNMFEVLYNVAKENDADIVKSNYYKYKTETGESIFYETLEGKEYNKPVSTTNT